MLGRLIRKGVCSGWIRGWPRCSRVRRVRSARGWRLGVAWSSVTRTSSTALGRARGGRRFRRVPLTCTSTELARRRRRVAWSLVCRRMGLDLGPFGDQVLKLSVSTDTSVALANFPKRECAGGSARGLTPERQMTRLFDGTANPAHEVAVNAGHGYGVSVRRARRGNSRRQVQVFSATQGPCSTWSISVGRGFCFAVGVTGAGPVEYTSL